MSKRGKFLIILLIGLLATQAVACLPTITIGKKDIPPDAPPPGMDEDTLADAPPSPPQEEVVVDVSEQIIAAITSKNTQALEGYMADTVMVRLEASGCCGPISKTEAISQLSYLDAAVNWDFDPSNPIIIDLASAAPDYYGSDWIVGVASNEFVVSFKLDNQNKMDAYNLAATFKLLIP